MYNKLIYTLNLYHLRLQQPIPSGTIPWPYWAQPIPRYDRVLPLCRPQPKDI